MKYLKIYENFDFNDEDFDYEEEQKEDFFPDPELDFVLQIDILVERHEGRNYIDILKDFTLNALEGEKDKFTIDDMGNNSFLQLYNGKVIGSVKYFDNNDNNPYLMDMKQRYKRVIEVCQADEIVDSNGGEIDYDNIRLIPFHTFREFILQVYTTFITYLINNISHSKGLGLLGL